MNTQKSLFAQSDLTNTCFHSPSRNFQESKLKRERIVSVSIGAYGGSSLQYSHKTCCIVESFEKKIVVVVKQHCQNPTCIRVFSLPSDNLHIRGDIKKF